MSNCVCSSSLPCLRILAPLRSILLGGTGNNRPALPGVSRTPYSGMQGASGFKIVDCFLSSIFLTLLAPVQISHSPPMGPVVPGTRDRWSDGTRSIRELPVRGRGIQTKAILWLVIPLLPDICRPLCSSKEYSYTSIFCQRLKYPSCIMSTPSRSFRAPHRTNVDNVLHDALKNWLIAESKTPGGGYMSQARSSSPLPTYRCTSGLSTIRSWRERTQEASRFLAEIVRDASNPHATLT